MIGRGRREIKGIRERGTRKKDKEKEGTGGQSNNGRSAQGYKGVETRGQGDNSKRGQKCKGQGDKGKPRPLNIETNGHKDTET